MQSTRKSLRSGFDQRRKSGSVLCHVFRNSKSNTIARYGKLVRGPFESLPYGHDCGIRARWTAVYVAHGGPVFKFNEASSFGLLQNRKRWTITVQAFASGDERAQQCGWSRPSYGVSCASRSYTSCWDLMADQDQRHAARAMEAMLKMKKIDTLR